jgi:hypothetical protein
VDISPNASLHPGRDAPLGNTNARRRRWKVKDDPLHGGSSVSNSAPYCIAAIGHDGEPKTVLTSFDDVLIHLREAYNAEAREYADARATSAAEPDDPPVGGFGVWLRNRWGSEVEVGVGRDVWFLIRIQPRPSRVCSDHPPLQGLLVFYLDGGHYTDFEGHDLVSAGVAKQTLRRWLESNAFAEDGQAAAE